MRLKTDLDKSSRMTRPRRSLPTSTNIAEEMAMSEPEPMAIPISAAVSAGLSLIPSPTIAIVARLVAPDEVLRVFWR